MRKKRALYLNKCLQKTADIKALTDHMFEYAFAYETNEEAVLKRMEIGQVKRNPSGQLRVCGTGRLYDRGADGGYRGAYVCG